MHTSISSRTSQVAAMWAAALSLATAPLAAQEISGPDVWAANCGSCHRLRAVNSYSASQWNSIASHMGLVARLTRGETRAVRDFLVGSARSSQSAALMKDLVSVAASGGVGHGGASALPVESASEHRASPCCPPGAGRDLFRTRCAACHGAEGRGNGPAAVAMNPRPTDFTTASNGQPPTDTVIGGVIEHGRRGMPAFGRMLNRAEIDTLIFFVKSLRR